MRNKFRYLLPLMLCFGLFSRAEAQRDTVYVYEDVVVYDTIVVYDTVFLKSELNNLLLDELNTVKVLQLDSSDGQASLLLISEDGSATIPINSIMLSENIKKLESMKKLGFFGVLCFAFQTMVMAQTSYEVSLGSGLWWENYKYEDSQKPFAAMADVGVYAKRNFGNSYFGLRTGLEYAYLFGIRDRQSYATSGNNDEILDKLNSNYRAGMHNLSVPLLLYYDKFVIRPYAGINYNYLRTRTNNDAHNFGVIGGFDVKLSKFCALRVESSFNVTADYKVDDRIPNYNESGELVSYDNSRFKMRNSQANISFIYTFGKKKDETGRVE
ncbi:MAG: hypothetical protein ACK5IQ_07040 [Bacteroidales bacterium]